jgi:hypothetical protein
VKRPEGGSQIVAVLGVAAVLAGVAASSAGAEPDRLKLRIGSHPQLLSPTSMLLEVSYDCPAESERALFAAAVGQEGEGLASLGVFLDIPCTGRGETIVVGLGSPIPTATLELGPAGARATSSLTRSDWTRSETFGSSTSYMRRH